MVLTQGLYIPEPCRGELTPRCQGGGGGEAVERIIGQCEDGGLGIPDGGVWQGEGCIRWKLWEVGW